MRMLSRRSAAVLIATAIPVVLTVALTTPGCTGETYASPPDDASPPYILKEGCKFSIIGEYGRSSITSLVVTGVPADAASASISLNEYWITVSDCRIVENSHGLPIYED